MSEDQLIGFGAIAGLFIYMAFLWVRDCIKNMGGK